VSPDSRGVVDSAELDLDEPQNTKWARMGPKNIKTEVGAVGARTSVLLLGLRGYSPRREVAVGELPGRLSRRRNGGAELQRNGLFTAASAESNSSDDGRDEDCPLHSVIS